MLLIPTYVKRSLIKTFFSVFLEPRQGDFPRGAERSYRHSTRHRHVQTLHTSQQVQDGPWCRS